MSDENANANGQNVGQSNGRTVTAEEVSTAVSVYGSQRAAARVLGISRDAVARMMRAGPHALAAEARACGIALAGRRFTTTKPAPAARRLFFSLPRGRAFPVSDMAVEWGLSEETIRKHGRKLEAFGYIERTPGEGEWVAVVVHPETEMEGRK